MLQTETAAAEAMEAEGGGGGDGGGASAARGAGPPPSNQWTCAACSLRNEAAASLCDACEVARPAATTMGDTAAIATGRMGGTSAMATGGTNTDGVHGGLPTTAAEASSSLRPNPLFPLPSAPPFPAAPTRISGAFIDDLAEATPLQLGPLSGGAPFSPTPSTLPSATLPTAGAPKLPGSGGASGGVSRR